VPKLGCNTVNWLFGKEIEIPEEGEMKNVGCVADFEISIAIK
jgi:hypothetical protein